MRLSSNYDFRDDGDTAPTKRFIRIGDDCAVVQDSRTGILLAAILFLGGCTSPTEGGENQQEVFDLDFANMVATLTPGEPGESPGKVFTARAGDLFAVDPNGTAEFPGRAVRSGTDIYTTYNGIGWTKYGLGETQFRTGTVQMLAWDLRYLVEHESFRRNGTATSRSNEISGAGHFDAAGGRIDYTLTIETSGRDILTARVAASGALESPYTFAPGPALGWAIEIPPKSMGPEAISKGDTVTAERHAFIVQLINDHARNHAGLLPERITGEDLRVELLASGKSWPANHYTSTPMANQTSSGNLKWLRCEPTVGYYAAYGWDAVLFDSSWGGKPCK
jgi:hypothetical protein